MSPTFPDVIRLPLLPHWSFDRDRGQSGSLVSLMDEIVRRMPGRWRSLAAVAVDASGLSQAAVSSYFIRRVEHFGQKQRTWKHWLKWLAVVDVERQIILAQGARQAPWNHCATLPVLVGQAHENTPIGCVLADTEFDSERNHNRATSHLEKRNKHDAFL